MAGPVEQIGVIVKCPVCGTEVMQKAMIPMSVTDAVITYNCNACARKLLATGAEIVPA